MAALGFGMVRYADDFVILCRSQEQAESALGQSMKATIAEINRVTVGWFAYFRHCTWNIFDKYDGMVRQRLSRQLVKRHRTNPERICRKQRWSNAYFSERGYKSLRVAHSAYVESFKGTH